MPQSHPAEVVARVTERCFHHLHAPVLRVTGFDIPYPPPKLEEHHLPSVDRILDMRGEVVKTYTKECRRVLAPKVAAQINDILEGLQRPGGFGYQNGTGLSIPSAAKTGTTNSNRASALNISLPPSFDSRTATSVRWFASASATHASSRVRKT